METIVLSKNQRKRANRRARAAALAQNSKLVVVEPQQQTVSLQSVQKVGLPGQGKSRSARRRRVLRARGVRGGKGQTGQNLYLASLQDPENNPGAKIPDMVTFPSTTAQLTWDTTLAPATGGDGVAAILWPALGSPDAATVMPIITGTNNTTPGSVYTWIGNLWPKATALRGLSDSYRPVSACIYAEFIGASTNDGGQICMGIVPRSGAFTMAAKEALVSGFNTGAAQSFTKTVPLRNGAIVMWKPQDNQDLEYKDCQDNTANLHDLPFIFICTAGQSPSASLRLRFICNFELIPTTDTASIINPTQSVSNLGQLESAMNWASHAYNNMSMFVSTVSPFVQPVINRVIQGGVQAAISGTGSRGSRLLTY